MSNPITQIVDGETGEVIEREMTADEVVEFQSALASVESSDWLTTSK
jgi:uncharacterized FlaG/YvyC family protein